MLRPVKREMELIRKILRAIEDLPPGADNIDPGTLGIEHDGTKLGSRNMLLVRHVQLLLDHGLVEANVPPALGRGPVAARIDRLTWAGHEFLAAAQDDTIWNAKKK